MKNVNVYNYTTMVGKNFIATPFVINYGYTPDEHGYEEDIMDYEYNEESRNYDFFNVFGKEKIDVIREINEYVQPKNYFRSIGFGNFNESLRGVPIKEYNTVHILIYENRVKVVCSYLFDSHDNEQSNEMLLMYAGYLNGKDYPPLLISTDIMLFKYTAELYKGDYHLRLLKDCVTMTTGTSVNQYDGNIRMDAGKDEDSNRIEKFSMCKTILLNNDKLIKSTIEQMKNLEYEYESEEV